MRLFPKTDAALRALALCLAAASLAPAARAQGADFLPVLYVNDSAITGFELDQRIRFLEVLGTQGDVAAIARDALIDDRLRMQTARAFGVEVTDPQVVAGMTEFAGRANLDLPQFLSAVGEAGVAPETFRDFVKAGLAWRELVQGRFGQRTAISDAAAERALALESNRGLPPRVLVSEMIVPAEPGESREELLERVTELAARLRGETAFAAAAERLSVAATAPEGGRLDWRPILDLPAPARAALAGLQPGQVSKPVPVGNAAAVFLLRGVREATDVAPEGPHVEYAELVLADAGDAARVSARIDRCGDLFAETRPDDGRLTFATVPEARLPADLRGVLAGLDANETAVITRGGAPLLVMLCARRAGGPTDVPSVDAMRGLLLNEQLAGEAELWLADLRADALIRDR